ncbi:MAG: tyrosine-type recombinase/integrase [Campylobacterota bacterium]|nr:tyrosine-type recombinase/integrase [Campylobacterota bacterium]
MSNIRGDGLFKIRGRIIYVHGTINGVFYRKSTGRKLTAATKQWMKKTNPLTVLAKILEVEDKVPEVSSDFETFGYMVLELTSSRRNTTSQADLIGLFKNRILPVFKKFSFEDIKPIDLIRFIEEQKKQVTNDRARRIKNTFSLILDYAVDDGLIQKNPMHAKTVSLIDFTYVPENTEAYNTDEISLILTNARGWFKIFLDLSFKLGLRSGEAMGMKWSDIDFETGKFQLQRSITKGVITEHTEFTKSNKDHYRKIQIFPESLLLLKAYYDVRPSDDWLFINKDGRYYRESKTIVDYHLKPLLKKIGVKYKTLYGTRRSYASIMYYGGENMNNIQEVMGHSTGSCVTKKHYIDPRILKQEHDMKRAEKSEELFNMMVKS